MGGRTNGSTSLLTSRWKTKELQINHMCPCEIFKLYWTFSSTFLSFHPCYKLCEIKIALPVVGCLLVPLLFLEVILKILRPYHDQQFCQQTHRTTSIRNSSCSPLLVSKNPAGDILARKRAIGDLLVAKLPDEHLIADAVWHWCHCYWHHFIFCSFHICFGTKSP